MADGQNTFYQLNIKQVFQWAVKHRSDSSPLPQHEEPASPAIAPLTHHQILSPHPLPKQPHVLLKPRWNIQPSPVPLSNAEPALAEKKQVRAKPALHYLCLKRGQRRVFLSTQFACFPKTCRNIMGFEISLSPTNMVAIGQRFQKLVVNM